MRGSVLLGTLILTALLSLIVAATFLYGMQTFRAIAYDNHAARLRGQVETIALERAEVLLSATGADFICTESSLAKFGFELARSLCRRSYPPFRGQNRQIVSGVLERDAALFPALDFNRIFSRMGDKNVAIFLGDLHFERQEFQLKSKMLAVTGAIRGDALVLSTDAVLIAGGEINIKEVRADGAGAITLHSALEGITVGQLQGDLSLQAIAWKDVAVPPARFIASRHVWPELIERQILSFEGAS